MKRMFAVCIMALQCTVAAAVAQSPEIEIILTADNAAQRAARDQLRRILDQYDLKSWYFTRQVRIVEQETPHSHPVLTLNTGSLDDDAAQLATFLHEQLHWRVDELNDPKAKAAIEEFRTIYPNAPGREGGGARSQFSTYLHLIVCDMELQSLSRTFGESKARAVLAAWKHYPWIYGKVLNDPQVREVTRKHGFTAPSDT